MSEHIMTTCPFCNKPHTVNLSTFESSSPVIPQFSGPGPGFWSSEAGVTLIAALLPAVLVLAVCWWYGLPVWIAAAVGVLAAVGLPVLKLVWAQPRMVQEKPDRVRVDVAITDTSDRGYTLALDNFNVDLVEWQDLVKLARADGFSRAAACEAGLSQAKWHKIKAEFLRLNYCVPLPLNQKGYSLTIRGRHLLAKIRDVSKQQQTNKGKVWAL